MKKMNWDSTKSVALALIAVFMVLFAHSEINHVSESCGTHELHDYCRVVDGAAPEVKKPVQISILKLIALQPDFIFHTSPTNLAFSLNRYAGAFALQATYPIPFFKLHSAFLI
ncbi:MAG: hypothetical protein LWX56_12970 [Ignavibacteria bacterium]|nr:hypothetical protein [Ignavibacteria bacterium]